MTCCVYVYLNPECMQEYSCRVGYIFGAQYFTACLYLNRQEMNPYKLCALNSHPCRPPSNRFIYRFVAGTPTCIYRIIYTFIYTYEALYIYRQIHIYISPYITPIYIYIYIYIYSASLDMQPSSSFINPA